MLSHVGHSSVMYFGCVWSNKLKFVGHVKSIKPKFDVRLL